MDTSSKNFFDCLPDELIEYIFLSIVYSPPIELFNHVNIAPSSFYFSYALHQPYLRRTHKDLSSLKLVCRRFYNLLRSSTFWQCKCRHDHISIVNEPLAIRTGVDFRRLYVSNPFHPDYNLLGSHITHSNEIYRYWNGSIEWEQTPIGCDLLYDNFGLISSCFATSYTWGEYHHQAIQLLPKEQNPLTSINPIIEFSVYIAGRWDCASICYIRLSFSDGHQWVYERTFSHGECQWHRITYRYVNYPKNKMPDSVSICLRGKDQQFWAGHYGTKFAQMRLNLALRKDDDQLDQMLDDVITQRQPTCTVPS